MSIQRSTLATDHRRNPLVIVAATDKDSVHSAYGQIRYYIKAGNDRGYFEIDPKSGELFISDHGHRSLANLDQSVEHRLTVDGKDGGGLESSVPALVQISVLDDESDAKQLELPYFNQRQFNFDVIENVAPGAIVGTVQAYIKDTSSSAFSSFFGGSSSSSSSISYAIYSGDPDGYFTIDPRQGTISVKSTSIDREKYGHLLLNVQAFAGKRPGPYRYAHTQVNVTILDENDNAPLFPSDHIKISVPESSAPNGSSFVFATYAVDYDAGEFGQIRYSIVEAGDQPREERFPFWINETSGHVRLREELDFERRSSYKLNVIAKDGGGLSSEMIVDVMVQDVSSIWCSFFVQFNDPQSLCRSMTTPLNSLVSHRPSTICAGSFRSTRFPLRRMSP